MAQYGDVGYTKYKIPSADFQNSYKAVQLFKTVARDIYLWKGDYEEALGLQYTSVENANKQALFMRGR